MDDACYIAYGLRGLGLVSADRDTGVRMLGEAHGYTRRYRDVYPWVRAVVLTDLVELQQGTDRRVLDEAVALTALGPLPDLAERLVPFRQLPARDLTDAARGPTHLQTAGS